MSKIEKEQLVEVLWTGGFDSSFRIVELSQKPCTVQPYYISDNREIENRELKAIHKITQMLRSDPRTKAKINDIELIKRSDIVCETDISAAYNRLKEKYHIGSQYEWLAVFVKKHPGIELGAVGGGKIEVIVMQNGAYRHLQDEILGENYAVDQDKTVEDVVKIYGRYHFPLLRKTKKTMLQLYKEMGYIDVMKETWFCHHPVDGKPCGVCNPCAVTIQEGLEERFDEKALNRYKHRAFYLKAYAVKRKVKKLFQKLWGAK